MNKMIDYFLLFVAIAIFIAVIIVSYGFFTCEHPDYYLPPY